MKQGNGRVTIGDAGGWQHDTLTEDLDLSYGAQIAGWRFKYLWDFTCDSEIPAEIQVLVVIHPKGISETTQYAIDQFVLRGGRLLAFLDPKDMLDPTNQGMGSPASSSNLEKLLSAWGLKFETNKVVADMNYFAQTRQGRAPAILLLNEKAMNQEDIVTADADNIVMAMAGDFSGLSLLIRPFKHQEIRRLHITTRKYFF